MGCKITNIEYFLPVAILNNEMLVKEYKDWDPQKIEEKTGIRERHVAGEHETSLDMAVQATLKVLNGFDKDKIDFLIFCTETPDYYLPPSSCLLQHRLGLAQNIGCFDFNLGCSGFVYGLAISKSLIASGIAKCILLVTSDTYTKLIHPQDRVNRTIFGDAAAATIIEHDSYEGIREFVFGTDGSGGGYLIVPNGGFRHRYDANAPVINNNDGSIRTENNLYMNGPEIFNFMIKTLPDLFKDVLVKNKMHLIDVDYVILHQANKYMLSYIRSKLNIPEDKFYVNMLHTGNTVASSIPIAIRDCLDTKIISPGEKIFLAGFGVGLSWIGTIVEF